jgi:uncharacterized membrane protein YgdD (TMEM256/DUF423 family)
MNVIKVYLKSSITKMYHYAQGAFGILLILNALREYEHVEGQKLALLLSVVAGTFLVLAWALPKAWRRKLRFLPGICIVLGALSLIHLTQSSIALAYYPFNNLILFAGYVLTLFGALQPILDANQVIYFSPEGFRYRPLRFAMIQRKWSEIRGVVFQEHGFAIEMNDGKSYKLTPYDAESQNLRVYIDKLMIAAKEGVDALREDDEIVHASKAKRRSETAA